MEGTLRLGLRWESGAKDARSPDASRSWEPRGSREASGVRWLQHRFWRRPTAVASGILPDVEPGLPARRRKPRALRGAWKNSTPHLRSRLFPGGKDARPLRQPRMVAATAACRGVAQRSRECWRDRAGGICCGWGYKILLLMSARGQFQNGFTLALIPAFSPGEKENHSPASWNIVRRSWQKGRRANRRRIMRSPLLGERARVREIVKTNPCGRDQPEDYVSAS